MIVPSYFLNLASSQNMQALLDGSQLELETQSIWRNFLNLGVPQYNLNFDAAIGRERIAAAASIVDPDAPAPLRSRPKLELYKGKIPAIKEKFRMNQDDMRNLRVLRDMPGATDALIRYLNSDLQHAAVAGDKRVDLMLLQAISTLHIDVSLTNNPDGVVYGDIDLLGDATTQLQGVPIVWSTAATATPITDIENFIIKNYNARGRQFGRILMSYELWLKFRATTEVQNQLKTFYNVGRTTDRYAATLTNVNDMFAANNWPPIEVINHTTNVEVDGVPTYIKPFNVNNVAFIPSGRIGTLFNGISMEAENRVPGKTYANFGPTLVSKWLEQDPLVEFTAMEMLAFPSINVDSVYVLKTDTVKATFD